LLIGTLTLLASGGAAQAATHIALDGYCNNYAIRNAQGTMAVKDTGCSAGFGGGFLTTIRNQGKTAVIGLTDPSTAGVQFVFRFSYPFVTGGTWTLFDTSDGVHFNLLAGGTYTIPAPGRPAEKGARSATGIRR
jgi:hypothetical protein